MTNCIICDNSNAPHYKATSDEYYCSQCNYWISRAKGETFGWKELTELLDDDTITYSMEIEGGKDDAET